MCYRSVFIARKQKMVRGENFVYCLVEAHIPSFYRVGVGQGICLSLFGTGPVAQVGIAQVSSGIS